MNTPEVQTNLTNPPAAQTKMVAGKKPNTVRLFVLREFQVKTPDGANTRIAQPGEIVEVSKAEAKDLVKTVQGGYAFSGERYLKDGDVKRHDLTRARLATEKDLFDAKPLDNIDEA